MFVRVRKIFKRGEKPKPDFVKTGPKLKGKNPEEIFSETQIIMDSFHANVVKLHNDVEKIKACSGNLKSNAEFQIQFDDFAKHMLSRVDRIEKKINDDNRLMKMYLSMLSKKRADELTRVHHEKTDARRLAASRPTTPLTPGAAQ